MIYPETFEDKIGFSQVRKRVIDLCESPVGKELAEVMSAAFDREEVAWRLDGTDELSGILRFGNDFPDIAPVDIRNPVARGMVIGAWLDIPDWLDIRRLIQSVRQIELFFERKERALFPVLRKMASGLRTYPVIQERLDQVFGRNGQVRDQASPLLRQIRQDMVHIQSSIGRRLERILQSARSEGWIDQDTQASIRDGRLVIPIPAYNKRKIAGLVHDESATGKTAFVEPLELVELNNQLRELELAEQREIIRILTDLTNALRPYFPEMGGWNLLLGELDLVRAKARLSNRWEGCKPLLTDQPEINWLRAKHPLLYLVFLMEGRQIVPQDIRLTPEKRILLISGPNAGGKSVCLKSVGLIQYLIQCGFLPPVAEGSISGVFKQFMVDIGDEQSLENDLSTYSSHLLHMKQFIRRADGATLFLIDEFGAGTEPQLGGAIAESILEEVTAAGAFGVITTHYSNLKHFASAAEGIINAAMRFDAQKMKPLFELEIGKPGSSFAFEIARNIGLPENVLERASAKIGTHQVSFDKHLRQISRDKRYWEEKRDKIRRASRDLDELMQKYTEMVGATEKERKKILAETRRESEELLAGINRQIEQAIREIRESQAEKERSKEVRSELENLRGQVKEGLEKRVRESDEALAAGQETAAKARKKFHAEPPPQKEKEPEASSSWIRGRKIRLRDRDLYGEIIDTREGSLLIAVGQMITTVPADQVEPVSEKEYREKTGITGKSKPFGGYDLEERRLSFSPNLDLRGLRADEALQRVTEFIDEAVMVGSSSLRILHGKGDGILRHLIREYLSGIDVVSHYQDEDVRFGGTGITIVTLSF
ncbi:MAG: Smr/MutS family protein [Bacteroidales bacterium]